MTLISGLMTTFSVFCLVALRAIQQQNVIHKYYWWAIFTSFFIAFAEIALILYVVKIGWAAGLWVGAGGALGVTFAMYFHQKYIQKPCVKGETH